MMRDRHIDQSMEQKGKKGKSQTEGKYLQITYLKKTCIQNMQITPKTQR